MGARGRAGPAFAPCSCEGRAHRGPLFLSPAEPIAPIAAALGRPESPKHRPQDCGFVRCAPRRRARSRPAWPPKWFLRRPGEGEAHVLRPLAGMANPFAEHRLWWRKCQGLQVSKMGHVVSSPRALTDLCWRWESGYIRNVQGKGWNRSRRTKALWTARLRGEAAPDGGVGTSCLGNRSRSGGYLTEEGPCKSKGKKPGLPGTCYSVAT